MKEAIGGSWLYTLVIVLIALFTTFVSVTTNYTRTYKVKDQLIAIIETNGGVTKDTLQDISDYLSSIGYGGTGACPTDTKYSWYPFSNSNTDGPMTANTKNANYCIYRNVVAYRTKGTATKTSHDGSASITRDYGQTIGAGFPRSYYGVTTFFRLDWPIIRYVLKLELSGETAVLYSYNECDEIEVFKDKSYCK